jgi:hypothetical protein
MNPTEVLVLIFSHLTYLPVEYFKYSTSASLQIIYNRPTIRRYETDATE